MKVTRKLLIRQIIILNQIQAICNQTVTDECSKCPYDGILCGRNITSPDRWDLETFLNRVNEWEESNNV